jgi:hypothetical protein
MFIIRNPNSTFFPHLALRVFLSLRERIEVRVMA